MSSQRLRSTLHHSVPKPASRPVPLWQSAAPLDPAARTREKAAPHTPSSRCLAEPAESSIARQTAILHARDAEDRRRIVLATVVVCTGVFVAGTALWQARYSRGVYIPVPSQPTAPAVATFTTPVPRQVASTALPAVTVFAADTQHRPVAVPNVVGGNQSGSVARPTTAAPAMPLTWTPPPAFSEPTPVDYNARARQISELASQIERLDETVRRVRADPHWYGIIKGSTNISRQQASDSYLAELDRQRNELRRQKWALEGR